MSVATITFLRFNIYNDMIMFYGHDYVKAQIAFLSVLVSCLVGQALIGYVIQIVY